MSGPASANDIFECLEKIDSLDNWWIIYSVKVDFEESKLLMTYQNRIQYSFRTVYELDLSQELDLWLTAMKRDSRKRFRDIIEKLKKGILEYQFFDFNSFESSNPLFQPFIKFILIFLNEKSLERNIF